MLNYTQYSEDPTIISHVERIGEGVRLLHDPNAAMVCTVARSDCQDFFGNNKPSLKISGANRKSEEWFGLEIDLTLDTAEISLDLRVFPAVRLYPRMYFDLDDEVRYFDLPDVSASDSFATRVFHARQWRSHPEWSVKAKSPRILLLVPSTPWFILESAELKCRALDDA